MKNKNILRKLEGLHTVETVSKELKIKKQSAINLLSKLKKKGYITTSGGGKQKRLYKITMRKQRPREKGMFDIINKYSPMKLNEWYDHQVHGHYGPEEALVDAVQTQSFRVILASLKLFNHITNWKNLYTLAKKKNVWQQIGALYDLSHKYFRVKKLPKRYRNVYFRKKRYLIKKYKTKEKEFIKIEKKWNIYIPFKKADIYKVIS